MHTCFPLWHNMYPGKSRFLFFLTELITKYVKRRLKRFVYSHQISLHLVILPFVRLDYCNSRHPCYLLTLVRTTAATALLPVGELVRSYTYSIPARMIRYHKTSAHRIDRGPPFVLLCTKLTIFALCFFFLFRPGVFLRVLSRGARRGSACTPRRKCGPWPRSVRRALGLQSREFWPITTRGDVPI